MCVCVCVSIGLAFHLFHCRVLGCFFFFFFKPLHKDEAVAYATQVLQIFYLANMDAGEPISYTEFYNDAVNEVSTLTFALSVCSRNDNS
jgi:hypothetical protein